VGVHYVAYAYIQVAVHPLKSGGDDPLFGSWHHEFEVAYLLPDSPRAKPLCYSDMFAGLT
jgi:hypothetical protein